MNRILVRIIASLIPSRERRRAFRERHLAPKKSSSGGGVPADLDKRLRGIESQLNTLVHFCFQKELYPGFSEKLRVGFPVSEAILSQLTGHTWANSGNGAGVKKQFISEQISLAAAMIHILPDDALFGIFRKLIALCVVGDANYKTLCNHWCWLLWRTGRHAENLRLMNEFFPAGTDVPAHILRRFATSARVVGDDDLARRLMREHLEKFGKKDLWKSAVAAQLASELGARDANIDSVLRLNGKISESARERALEKMFAGKRVAVVGNGPQEVGSGNGAKIDACDVVIRFNDFPSAPEFVNDYGGKTNIWVRSLWVNAPRRAGISDVVVGEALHAEYPDLKIIREVLEMPSVRVFAIPAEVYYRVHAAGVNHPTNGTLMLAWIKEICPDFSASDCFGFSFKAEIAPKSLTHYYDSPDLQKGSAHNLDKERAFLRKLFGLEGD